MISNMGLVRQLFRCLVSLSAITLVSCIDGREEIWLNANGSGRADVSYSIPAMAANFRGGEDGIRRLIAGFLKDNPAISTSSLDVFTVGDRLKIRVQGKFDSALELKELSQSAFSGELPSSARFMAGEVTVKTKGLTVDFARTISPGKALPGAAFLPKSQTKDRSLTYIIHLPEAATNSNATRIEDAGRTLIWEYPLAQAIQNPVTTRFEAPIPIPSWIHAASLATVSILLFLIFRRCRKSGNPGKIHPAA
jgi:hypothetical protein